MSVLEDAWLAGFIDGEGCFTASHTNGRAYPRFAIGLRNDDAPILHLLHAELGGGLTTFHQPEGRRQPQIRWSLQGQPLRHLVDYLDVFSLRTKKADQFAAWRNEHGI